MSRSRRRSRLFGTGSAVVVLAAVASWATVRATASLAAAVVLTAVAGIVTFAVSLAPSSIPRRHRTMATGLVLVGAAAVVASLHQTATNQRDFLLLSGAGLFCAAELADRALSRARGVQCIPGTDRLGPVWVTAVALSAAALSYGAVSARNVLAGGGPAALVAGTLAATLVAFLSLGLSVRARSRG